MYIAIFSDMATDKTSDYCIFYYVDNVTTNVKPITKGE